MWRAHLLQTFLHGMEDERWIFVTLTAPSWAHYNPLKSLKSLKKGWGKMYDKLRYKNGGKLSYVMVYETHKSGAFHVHALANMGDVYDASDEQINSSFQGEERIKAEKAHQFCVWLKDKATNSKIGWVCHATRIKEGDTQNDNARLAVGYIAKYFTKGSLEMAMPARWRRIGTSRDIGSPKTKSKKEFTWVVRHSISERDVRAIPHYLMSENRLLDASDFGDTGLYPESDEEA